MNLNQLIYASKINRLGSFSRAARALYISQSTLSKSIRALEEEMEHEIFIRTPDGIVTTDFGRALLAEAEKIIQHVENIQNLAAHSGQISGQPLHFSASCGQMMFASEIFARLLGKYRNDKTDFRFYQKSYSDVFLDVKEERSNLGIVMTLDSHTEEARELFRQNDMDYYTLRRLKIGVAVSLNNPLNNMGLSRLRKEHLADQTLLLTQESVFPFTKEAPELINAFGASKVVYVADNDTALSLAKQIPAYICVAQSAGIYNKLNLSLSAAIYPCQNINLKYEFGWIKKRRTELTRAEQDFIHEITELFQ